MTIWKALEHTSPQSPVRAILYDDDYNVKGTCYADKETAWYYSVNRKDRRPHKLSWDDAMKLDWMIITLK